MAKASRPRALAKLPHAAGILANFCHSFSIPLADLLRIMEKARLPGVPSFGPATKAANFVFVVLLALSSRCVDADSTIKNYYQTYEYPTTCVPGQ
jgi:hypothetical protein